MEFTEVVRRRRMVRTFTGEPVPRTSLEAIRFWTVAGAAVADSARTAPLVIVPMSCKRVYLDRYAEPDKGWTDRDEARWPVPFWHIDTGMAALLILQTAVDEGLGAVYFGIVPEALAPFREAFGVPGDHEPIGAIAIGYDAETDKRDLRSRRRDPGGIVHYGRWRGLAATSRQPGLRECREAGRAGRARPRPRSCPGYHH